MRRSTLRRITWGPFIAVAFFSACTSSQHANDPNANPVVVVYRYERVPDDVEQKLYCDGVELASVPNAKYLTVQLAPGEHEFRVGTWGTYRMTTQRGRLYYLSMYGRAFVADSDDAQLALTSPSISAISKDAINSKFVVGTYSVPVGGGLQSPLISDDSAAQ